MDAVWSGFKPMSQLIVLEREGKKKYEWNPEEEKSVETARRIFENKLSEGYAAFKLFQSRNMVDTGGPQQQTQLIHSTTLMGEQMQEFDNRAETIQMTPPMVGG